MWSESVLRHAIRLIFSSDNPAFNLLQKMLCHTQNFMSFVQKDPCQNLKKETGKSKIITYYGEHTQKYKSSLFVD